ncbi:hypothetical protein SK128_013773 [Halocaridina rubra]|uniref:Uncharacterized protein n=1 Tax=Halocaridina rubra TaxID=373956 RepID=A0AAN8XG61_HALRR
MMQGSHNTLVILKSLISCSVVRKGNQIWRDCQLSFSSSGELKSGILFFPTAWEDLFSHIRGLKSFSLTLERDCGALTSARGAITSLWSSFTTSSSVSAVDPSVTDTAVEATEAHSNTEKFPLEPQLGEEATVSCNNHEFAPYSSPDESSLCCYKYYSKFYALKSHLPLFTDKPLLVSLILAVILDK